MSCSLAWRTLTLRSTKPSARSARMPTSLAESIGAPSPDATRPASIVTSSGDTPDPSICRLQRMQGPRSGMPWRSSAGGCGGGVRAGLAPDHRDQVLVVGAVVLVFVGDRTSFAPVVDDLVLRAGGIVGRSFTRFLLRVEPGHDHDAVVVARCGDRVLDRAVGAFGLQLLVESFQRVPFLAGDRLARLARAQEVASGLGFFDRLVEPLHRVLLADDPRDAGAAGLDGRGQRARRRHLAAGAGSDRAVGRRIRPVGGPLDVSERDARREQRSDRHEYRAQQGPTNSDLHHPSAPFPPSPTA